MVHRAAVRPLRVKYNHRRRYRRTTCPRLEQSEVQHLETTTGCSYVRPLLGYGKPEEERLAGRLLVVQYGETGRIGNGDYEQEIRGAICARGIDPASFFPPNHLQSLVVGRKET